jgi:hypothetical protein
MTKLTGLVLCTTLLLSTAVIAADPPDRAAEIEQVRRVVDAAIGWALPTKNRELGLGVMAHDPDFFIFHPNAAGTVVGYDAFESLFDRALMNPAFKATGYEIRDLRVNLSRGLDVAWFSAVLDDCGEWNGKPSCWRDTRWTGVLEKRDGRWVVVQMHFSFPSEQCAAAKEPEGAAEDPPPQATPPAQG